jgi:ribosome-binding protein aMBF1 (putative translation factor)
VARVYRKIERSADEQAELQRIRSAPRTAETTGKSIGSDGYNALMRLIGDLRSRREQMGIEQAELAERMKIEAPALCRLETFKVLNPTVWTLLKWAEALDCSIGLDLRVREHPRAKTAVS